MKFPWARMVPRRFRVVRKDPRHARFDREARLSGVLGALAVLAGSGAVFAPVISVVAADLGRNVAAVQQAVAVSLALALLLTIVEVASGRSLVPRHWMAASLIAAAGAYALLAIRPSMGTLYAAFAVGAVVGRVSMPLRPAFARRYTGGTDDRGDGAFNARSQRWSYWVQTLFPLATMLLAVWSWRLAAALLALWLVLQSLPLWRIEEFPTHREQGGDRAPLLDQLRDGGLWRALVAQCQGQLVFTYLALQLEPLIRSALLPSLGHLRAFATIVTAVVIVAGAARLLSIKALEYYGRAAGERIKQAAVEAARLGILAAACALVSAWVGMPGLAAVVFLLAAVVFDEVSANSVSNVTRTFLGRLSLQAYAISSLVTAVARYSGAQLAVVLDWRAFSLLWIMSALFLPWFLARRTLHVDEPTYLQPDGELRIGLVGRSPERGFDLIVTGGDPERAAIVERRVQEHDVAVLEAQLVPWRPSSRRVRRGLLDLRWPLRPKRARRDHGSLWLGCKVPIVDDAGIRRGSFRWWGGRGTWSLDQGVTVLRSDWLAAERGWIAFDLLRHNG